MIRATLIALTVVVGLTLGNAITKGSQNHIAYQIERESS